MEAKRQNSELDPKYLLGQLNTARKEINNLRQQIRSLRYVHEKDVDSIKRLLGSCKEDKRFLTMGLSLSSALEPSTSSDGDEGLKLKPIGMVSTWFPSKRGTPRQPGICGTAPGKLTLFNSVFTNPEHALEGLQDFSHMWILFHFHRNDSTHVRAKVAPPRLNGARTGVFSTRSPHRPCPIGLSLVKIVKIENCTIYFEGVDMVDQTPVLDVKPYIPQYDNPLHVEKLNGRESENSFIEGDSLEAVDQRLGDRAGLSSDANQRLNASNLTADCNEGLRTLLQDSYYVDSPEEAGQHTDMSRDEEIALRLQAEEFEGGSNFESYGELRNHFRISDINFENIGSLEEGRYVPNVSRNSELNRDGIDGLNSHMDIENASSETALQNHREVANVFGVADASFQSPRNGSNAVRPLGSQVENVRDMTHRVHSTDGNLQGNRNTAFASRSSDSNYLDETSRNSRLLDGADGSSGTDLDLIDRRTVNPRPDNSPVRMGVREAPDGEEGFASQNLTPSQTLSNIQSVTASNSNSSQNQNVRTENRSVQNPRAEANNTSEVRVPDWIARPRVSTLSVSFNERASVQLNEILGDKADEQKRAIENVLCEDPRSVYLRQRWGNQFYTFLIHELHISCRFDDNRRIVTVFQVRHAGRTCECGEPEWQCLGHSPLP